MVLGSTSKGHAVTEAAIDLFGLWEKPLAEFCESMQQFDFVSPDLAELNQPLAERALNAWC